MEYCNGGTLRERVVKKQKLSEKKTKQIVQQILEGVSYIHRMGICHRDLKPENILFHNKVAKVTDFGLARVMTDGLMTSLVGSPYYMAPEVIRGNYDTLCDMWSVGILICY